MSRKVSVQNESPIIRAILKNNVVSLKQELNSYYPSLDKNKTGQEAILLAVNKGSVEILNILLNAGITFNYHISNTFNPLNHAINNGSKNIALILIKNITDQDNLSIPDPAVIYDTFNSNKGLLTDKIYQYINDYPKKEKQSNNLNQAVIDKNSPLLIKLLSEGVNPNQRDPNGRTPLINAIDKNNNDAVQKLIKAGADYSLPDFDYRTPLMHAAENGNYEIVVLLINLGENPLLKGLDNKSAFSLATEKGHDDIVDFLIKNKENELNSNDINQAIKSVPISNEKLSKISNNGIPSKSIAKPKVNFLIPSNKESPMNNDSIEPLSNEYKQLQDNLKKGADPNKTDKNGLTPLMTSIETNNPRIIYLLIKYGANINLTDIDGNTALILAALHDSDIAIKELHKRGASLETKNIYGINALMLASMNNKQKAVKMLLKLGAQVNTKNIQGQTALMYAAYYNHDQVMLQLLAAQADKTIVDQYGRNALSLAYYRQNAKAIEILQK